MVALIICGVILLTVASRTILAPSDPLGCVSVLSCNYGWATPFLSALLAVALSAMITLISGMKLPEMGVFGVCIGLALANLRFENASHLWLLEGMATDASRRALAMNLTVETITWIAVLIGACLGSAWTARRLRLDAQLPKLQTEWKRGLATAVVMIAVAMALIPLLSTGTELTPIRTGQVYLAWAGGCYLATMAGYQLLAPYRAEWAYGAVVATSIAASAWGIIITSPTHPGRTIARLAQFPSSAYGRALPVEMIVVGIAAAIFGIWHHRQLTRFAYIEDARKKAGGSTATGPIH